MNYTILVDDIERNKERFEQIHTEPDLYGGSTVASICGVGYESPLEVWLKKTGKTKKRGINAQMKLGSFLEPFVRREFEARLGHTVRPVNQVWQSVERPWMIASPDAVVPIDDVLSTEPRPGDQLVEIKTGRWSGNSWSDKSASDSAMCQLQWYLAVGGQRGGYCVGMFGGDAENLFTPYFASDVGVQRQLIERVEQFREFVKTDTPPVAGPGDADLIREYLVPGVRKKEQVDLTETHYDLLKEWDEIHEKLEEHSPLVRQLEERKKAIKNQILVACAGAELVTIGPKTFQVSEVCRESFTVNASRYFSVKQKKEK